MPSSASTASTRVSVHSGTVTVQGEGSRALVLGPGQDVMFVARDLEQVEPLPRAPDLRAAGLQCEPVLTALRIVERHRFVDTALATQASSTR